jgi:hypothetical protein
MAYDFRALRRALRSWLKCAILSLWICNYNRVHHVEYDEYDDLEKCP